MEYPYIDYVKQPLKNILSEMIEYCDPQTHSMLCDAIRYEDAGSISKMLLDDYCSANNDWFDLLFSISKCSHISVTDISTYQKLLVKYTSYSLLRRYEIFSDESMCVFSKYSTYRKRLIFFLTKIIQDLL